MITVTFNRTASKKWQKKHDGTRWNVSYKGRTYQNVSDSTAARLFRVAMEYGDTFLMA